MPPVTCTICGNRGPSEVGTLCLHCGAALNACVACVKAMPPKLKAFAAGNAIVRADEAHRPACPKRAA